LATVTSEERGWYVVWSPDGSRVAFDVEPDGQRRFYTVNSDGSGELAETSSIPDSWYPWYWPQWAGEEAVTAATPLPSMGEQARAFAEPILAAIANRPPDFEDDFSAAGRGWSTWIGKMGRPGDFAIEDGVARFRLAQAELAMEHQALAQKDFVLQLDAHLATGDATSRMRVEFRVPLPEAGYKVELFSELGGWSFEWGQWGADQFQRIEGKGNVSPPGEATQVTIVARGPEVAIYLNGTPVFYAEDADLDVAGRAYMMCHSLSETACEFDNVEFWDLANVPAVSSAGATPAPQPTATPTPLPSLAAPEPSPSPPSAGTGSATGHILWNDEPFAEVVVKLCTEWSMIGGCKGAEYTAVSSADGRYTIAGLPPGSYRIATQIPGQEKETGWMGMRAEVRSGEVAQVKDLYVVKYDLQLLSPHEEETVQTATPALTWAGYSHAAYYKVYLAPWGGGEAVIQFEKTAETTYTVASPLQAGKYHWSIHAYNAQETKLAEGSGRFIVAGD
jgi:hypothetical protein